MVNMQQAKDAMDVLAMEIRRLEAEIKVTEDPLPLIEAVAFLNALHTATVQRLEREQ